MIFGIYIWMDIRLDRFAFLSSADFCELVSERSRAAITLVPLPLPFAIFQLHSMFQDFYTFRKDSPLSYTYDQCVYICVRVCMCIDVFAHCNVICRPA